MLVGNLLLESLILARLEEVDGLKALVVTQRETEVDLSLFVSWR